MMERRGWVRGGGKKTSCLAEERLKKRVAVGLDWFAEELVVSLLFREQEIRERN